MRSIPQRILALTAAVLCLPWMANHSRADAPQLAGEPVIAVATFAGYDALIRDVEMLGELGEMPALRSMFEGLVAIQTGGKGLTGLDKSRPWGIVVLGAQLTPVALVPVNDVATLTNTIASVTGSKLADLSDDTYRISHSGHRFLVRQHTNYAFATWNQKKLPIISTPPGRLLEELGENYDVAFRVHWQAVPQEYRTELKRQARAALENSLARRSNESPEDFAVREVSTRRQFERSLAMSDELDQITIGWNLDDTTQRIVLEAQFAALPGTTLAQSASHWEADVSPFAGFVDPAATFAIHAASPGVPTECAVNLADRLNTLCDQFVQSQVSWNDATDRAAAEEAIREIAESALLTLKEGGVECAASVHAGGKDISLVAAVQVSDSARIEASMRQLSNLNPKARIAWDQSTIGAVTLHGITVDKPDAADSSGEIRGVLGVAPNTLYLSFGKDPEQSLIEAIEKSQAEANQRFTPLQFALSIGDCLQQVENELPIAPFANTTLSDQDHLNVSIEGLDKEVRVRLEVESDLIRAFCKEVGARFNQKLSHMQGK